MKQFLKALTASKKVVYDHCSWIIPGAKTDSVFNPETLCKHLNSLSIISIGERTTNHVVVEVGSLHYEGTVKCYLRSTSLPQEAFDCYPLNSHDIAFDPTHIITTISKKNCGKMNVFVGNESIECLTSANPGFILGSGEHVEPSEKATMKAAEEKLRESKNGVYFITSSILNNVDQNKKLCPLERGLREECGLTFEGVRVHKLLFGVHDSAGRDERYWTIKYSDDSCDDAYEFGYQRRSKSWLCAVVVFANKTEEQTLKPTDLAEISSANFISLQKAQEQFGTEQMPAAFSAHVEQLKMLIEKLPAIYAECDL